MFVSLLMRKSSGVAPFSGVSPPQMSTAATCTGPSSNCPRMPSTCSSVWLPWLQSVRAHSLPMMSLSSDTYTRSPLLSSSHPAGIPSPHPSGPAGKYVPTQALFGKAAAVSPVQRRHWPNVRPFSPESSRIYPDNGIDCRWKARKCRCRRGRGFRIQTQAGSIRLRRVSFPFSVYLLL